MPNENEQVGTPQAAALPDAEERPVDATDTPLETEDAQTYQSPESLEIPASAVDHRSFDDIETDEPVNADQNNPVNRYFTDDGYVVDEYTQNIKAEENDFEVADTEDNDLEK